MKLTEERLKEFVMGGLPLNSEIKQQILDNQEFREQFDHYIDRELLREWFDTVTMSKEAFKKLEEKTEKWDILESAKTHEALVRYAELQQENKQLKQTIEKIVEFTENRLFYELDNTLLKEKTYPDFKQILAEAKN